MSEWRRADLGDRPEPGQIISMVQWEEGSSAVRVYERFEVAVVLSTGRIGVYGASLPFVSEERVEIPERPDDSVGPLIIMWKETS